DLRGATTQSGEQLTDMAAVTRYLLQDAGLAIVPFYAFGTGRESPWFRLSVGTCRMEDVDASMEKLGAALRSLQFS
ncbi:MAG TPA: pyridoxal phosphate-dependent aminotransferase, partial [Chitinophagales bacterium]|nr:pyridoxal phosphate-dependent aminotransferase [Chitinophagales bacterium]